MTRKPPLSGVLATPALHTRARYTPPHGTHQQRLWPKHLGDARQLHLVHLRCKTTGPQQRCAHSSGRLRAFNDLGLAPVQYATQAVVRAPRAPAAVHAAAAASAAFTETVEGPRKKAEARANPRGSIAARSMAPQRARPQQARRGAQRVGNTLTRRIRSALMYILELSPNDDKDTGMDGF